MKLRHLWQAAAMLTVSALFLVLLLCLGVLSFAYVSFRQEKSQSVSAAQISTTLTEQDGVYQFSGAKILAEHDLWAMLINEDGEVCWSYALPADVDTAYTLTDVASFTRWYLKDYPVQCHIRSDGLLVVGWPKDSLWKYGISAPLSNIQRLPWWVGGMFLVALSGVLALSAFLLRRWFRQKQQVRDAARSDWINGVSHDIRTPLSLIMGCASQLEEDKTLSPDQRRRAGIIRRQSQTLRDLVNDLNLTMRLDSSMQPLRREEIQPAAFLRQLTADFLNGGLGDGYPVELRLPDQPLPKVKVDAFLLSRAINNLLSNCVAHNAPGCPIRIGSRKEGKNWVIFVESSRPVAEEKEEIIQVLSPDGGAPHGTGLKLVAQIALAHGGRASFFTENRFRCTLELPVFPQTE